MPPRTRSLIRTADHAEPTGGRGVRAGRIRTAEIAGGHVRDPRRVHPRSGQWGRPPMSPGGQNRSTTGPTTRSSGTNRAHSPPSVPPRHPMTESADCERWSPRTRRFSSGTVMVGKAAGRARGARAVERTRGERQVLQHVRLVEGLVVHEHPSVGAAARDALAGEPDHPLHRVRRVAGPDAGEVADPAGGPHERVARHREPALLPRGAVPEDHDVPAVDGVVQPVDEDAVADVEGVLHRLGGDAERLDEEGLDERHGHERDEHLGEPRQAASAAGAGGRRVRRGTGIGHVRHPSRAPSRVSIWPFASRAEDGRVLAVVVALALIPPWPPLVVARPSSVPPAPGASDPCGRMRTTGPLVTTRA